MAVAGGREIASVINSLLSLPFALKIATRDLHPQDHISFAASHKSSDFKAFDSTIRITNPDEQSQSHEIPLWPVHCVQGTKGAQIIPEIDVSNVDHIVEKGRDSRVEMFSAFADVFGNRTLIATNMDLARCLNEAGITDVFTVGLAGDFCVKCTALDARKEGFHVYVVEEAIRSVDAEEKGWGSAKHELEMAGINVISIGGPEIEKVKRLQ